MFEPTPPPQPAHVHYERVIHCARCSYGVVNEMIKLDTRVFHPECFKCDECQESLVGKQVHNENGKNYDEECYREVATKRCDICEQPIVGENEKYIIAKGCTYHTTYVCSQCGVSLRKNRHTVDGKKRICQACVQENRRNPMVSASMTGNSRFGGTAFGESRFGRSAIGGSRFEGGASGDVGEEL